MDTRSILQRVKYTREHGISPEKGIDETLKAYREFDPLAEYQKRLEEQGFTRGNKVDEILKEQPQSGPNAVDQVLDDEKKENEQAQLRERMITESDDPIGTLNKVKQVENKVKDESDAVRSAVFNQLYAPVNQSMYRPQFINRDLSKSPIKETPEDPLQARATIGKSLLSSAYNIVGGTYGAIKGVGDIVYSAGAIPQNLIGWALDIDEIKTNPKKWKEVTPMLTKVIDEYVFPSESALEAGRQLSSTNYYDNSITGYLKEGDVQNGFSLLGYQIFEQLPQQALIIGLTLLSGGSATVGVGAISAIAGGQKYEDLKDKDEMNDLVKYTNAISTGLSEYLTERYIGTIPILNRILEQKGTVAIRGVKDGVKLFLKNIGYGMRQEGTEEIIAQTSENIIDILTENRTNGHLPGIFDGVGDAGLIGTATGGLLSGGGTVVSGEIKRGKQMGKVLDVVEKIEKDQYEKNVKKAQQLIETKKVTDTFEHDGNKYEKRGDTWIQVLTDGKGVVVSKETQNLLNDEKFRAEPWDIPEPKKGDKNALLEPAKRSEDTDQKIQSIRDYTKNDQISEAKPTKELDETRSFIQKAFGTDVIFVRGSEQNGMYHPEIPNTIFVDVDASNPLMTVVGHELTHDLEVESPDLYNELLEIADLMDSKRVDKALKGLNDLRSEHGLDPIERQQAVKEFIADFVGEQMGTKTFWENAYKKSPKLVQKMIRVLSETIKKLSGNVSETYRRADLIKTKKGLEKAKKIAEGVMAKRMIEKKITTKGTRKSTKKDTKKAVKKSEARSTPEPQEDTQRSPSHLQVSPVQKLQQKKGIFKGASYQLKAVQKTVRINSNKEDSRVFEVSVHPEELAKHKDQNAEIKIKTIEQAREINVNSERVKDWQRIYDEAETYGEWGKIRRAKAKSGKLLGLEVIQLTKGCQRTQTTIERVENGVLPPETRIEACYSGDCWVNSQFNRVFGTFENMEVRDLSFATKEGITEALSKPGIQKTLNKSLFIRQGYSGDGSHIIANGLALHWLKEKRKNGIKPKDIFISAGYAPVADAQYKALQPYADEFELHFSVSGWFHKNELMLRLAEFQSAKDNGLNAILRVITNADNISGVEMLNENFLRRQLKKMGVLQHEVLETPFHDDKIKAKNEQKRSEPIGFYKYVCCETGKCGSCLYKCMSKVGKGSDQVSFQLRDLSDGEIKGKAKEELSVPVDPMEGIPTYAIEGEEAKKEALFEKAKEVFGTTEDIKEAGYILPDGSLLDLSGKRHGGPSGSRAMDHRQLYDIADEEAGGDPSLEDYADMVSFMDAGAIRFGPESDFFDMNNMPEYDQLVAMRKIVTERNGEVIVEANNKGSIYYYEYDKGTPWEVIKRDITQFYRTGDKPSPVQQFHYQVKEKKNKTVLKKGDNYSNINREFNISLGEVYERYKKDIRNRHDIIDIGGISQFFLEVGVPDVPIVLKESVIRDKLDRHGYKGVKIIHFKDLPQKLLEPVAVFRSKTRPHDSIVVLTDMFINESPVVVPIALFKETQIDKYTKMVLNPIQTLHPRDYHNEVGKWIDEGYLLNLDKEKAKEWLLRTAGYNSLGWKPTTMAMEKLIKKPFKPQGISYQVKDIFYSQVEKIVEEKFPKKMKAHSVINFLKKHGAKPEELYWLGLDDVILGNKEVTKDFLTYIIKRNKVEIKEERRSVKVNHLNPDDIDNIRYDLGDLGYYEFEDGTVLEEADGGYRYNGEYFDLLEEAVEKLPKTSGTKYHEYTLPEGEHYKELLLIYNLPDYLGDYRGRHFDESNVLAHVRFNTRYDDSRSKTLFIEEIQSDWHSEGRKKGYGYKSLSNFPDGWILKKKEESLRLYDLLDEDGNSLTRRFLLRGETEDLRREEALKEYNRRKIATSIPNAPFKGTEWVKLVLKRMLRYGAENGFGRIAWTTGVQQVDRWESALRQKVDQIHWQKTKGIKQEIWSQMPVEDALKMGGEEMVTINGLREKSNVFKQTVPIEGEITINSQKVTLDGLLGKNMANQIRNSNKRTGIIEGDNLTIGGEGFKSVYDNAIPKFLNKFGKKFGTRVGRTDIGDLKRQPSMEITARMKDSVMGGQPLFQIRGKETVPESVYELPGKRTAKDRIKALLEQGKAKDEAGVARKAFTTFSTRLRMINPKLKRAIRKYQYRLDEQTMRDLKTVEKWMKAVKKMSKEDQFMADIAMKNGDLDRLWVLVDKYKLFDEYEGVRRVLDGIYNRAEEVGYDLGYIPDYFPRKVKDLDGLLAHLEKSADWGVIQQAIELEESELGRKLEKDEKVNLINKLIRGFGGKQLRISTPGNLKLRSVEYIDAEINKYYYDSNASLFMYITSLNEAIEAKRFFKKGAKDPNTQVDIDTIGDYVEDLTEKGMITRDQQEELKHLLYVRFVQTPMMGKVRTSKNIGYMVAMGSPISAITQIGDLAWSMYSGGVVRSAWHAGRAMVRQSKVTRKDIGVERIAEEFSDPSKSAKILNKLFKATGLTYMDGIGKEALINSTIQRFQSEARKGKFSNKSWDRITEAFGKEEIDGVIEDLKSGEMTDNIKYLAHYTLSDFQPVNLSEMPEWYLSAPNGRVLYMLKTFTIKQFDVMRNEALQHIKNGDVKKKAEGIKRLIHLASVFALANASADKLKDWILGRDTTWGELVEDNLLRLVGLSKFQVWYYRRYGLSNTVIRSVIPPMGPANALYEDMIRDLVTLYKHYDQDKIDEYNIWDARTFQRIPIAGKIYYWRLGGGHTYNEKRKEREKKKAEREAKKQKKLERKKEVEAMLKS